MFGVRVSKKMLAVIPLAVIIPAIFVWATTGSGTQSVLMGRATFQPTNGDVLQVQRVLPSKWGIALAAKAPLDVAVQTITFQPGGQSGWHTHPGPVFISVVSGEMTFYESNDPECKPIVRRAGEGYLDAGDHAHIARNESGAPAMNVVTYFAPAGAPLRIDAPRPGNCPF